VLHYVFCGAYFLVSVFVSHSFAGYGCEPFEDSAVSVQICSQIKILRLDNNVSVLALSKLQKVNAYVGSCSAE